MIIQAHFENIKQILTEEIKDEKKSKLHFSIAANQGDKESIKTLIDDK